MGHAMTSARWPRWVVVALGLICIVLGVVLIFHPFASLAVLVLVLAIAAILSGIGELVDGWGPPRRWHLVVIGALLIAAGLAMVLWQTIAALSLLAALALLASGVLRLIAVLSGRSAQKFTDVVAGAAEIVLGVLALAWPDITQFVLAVVFGIRTLALGLRLVTGRPGAPAGKPSGLKRLAAGTGAVLTLVVALLLAGVSVAVRRASPQPDAFYTPPASVPAQPGALLRSEPFTRAVPAGSHAWRILYTTTRDAGAPAVASALVVAGDTRPGGPAPVIAWAHGTTGFTRGCAPSLLRDPFTAGATPALPELLQRGWVLVATDYVGLGTEGLHPYLIGQSEARSVLDAVRAARRLSEVQLSEQTVVWGHSQGGHAALWTGILAPTYAPDVPLAGVAALAPASNLPELIDNLATVPGGPIFASYVAAAYTDIYPELSFREQVRPAARVQVREMAARCLAEPEVFASIVTSTLLSGTVWSRDPGEGDFGKRLRENIPSGSITAPLLIGQGEADALVLPEAQAAYVRQRCDSGGQVDYRTYPGRDHVGVVAADSPLTGDLLAWTADRLAGLPAASTC